jgi:hypothetical protein
VRDRGGQPKGEESQQPAGRRSAHGCGMLRHRLAAPQAANLPNRLATAQPTSPGPSGKPYPARGRSARDLA